MGERKNICGTLMPTREEAPGMFVDYTGMSGYLTRANVMAVADLIRQIIGRREYTFIVAGEWNGFKPEVRPNQYLTTNNSDPSGVSVSGDDEYMHITVCDSYGVWGLHVGEGSEPVYGEPVPRFATYVDMQYRNGWQMTFKLRAPGGNQIWWTVVVDETAPTFSADDRDEHGCRFVSMKVPKVGTIEAVLDDRNFKLVSPTFTPDEKLHDVVYNGVHRS
jgi:hypothetical protein